MADISVTITQSPDVTAVVAQQATVEAEVLGVGARGEQGEQGVQGIQGETGEQGTQGVQGEQGEQGIQGIQGIQGDPGESAFVYIAYASDGSGTGFTMTFNASLDYIAILTTDTEIPSPVVGDFAGLWKNYKGAQGIQGIQGIQGVQGDQGIQGETGEQGEQGIQGIQGIPGEVTTANSPNSGEFARFTGATTIEGRTPAETRADLDLEIGTDVQAYDADLTTWAGKTAPSGTVVGTSDTQTLTNKRVDKREVTNTSYTTSVTIDSDVTDILTITAQAGALLFNNPSGTPTQGQTLIIRIKDNGTARALTYDTQFRAMGTTLPTTTVLSKTLYMLFMRNTTDTKWDLLATNQEA